MVASYPRGYQYWLRAFAVLLGFSPAFVGRVVVAEFTAVDSANLDALVDVSVGISANTLDSAATAGDILDVLEDTKLILDYSYTELGLIEANTEAIEQNTATLDAKLLSIVSNTASANSWLELIRDKITTTNNQLGDLKAKTDTTNTLLTNLGTELNTGASGPGAASGEEFDSATIGYWYTGTSSLPPSASIEPVEVELDVNSPTFSWTDNTPVGSIPSWTFSISTSALSAILGSGGTTMSIDIDWGWYSGTVRDLVHLMSIGLCGFGAAVWVFDEATHS